MPNVQTPYSVVAAHAVLRIFGEHLDFAAVTQAIGQSPSETRRNGDLRPTGKPVLRDVWMLEAPLSKGEALGLHILWLKNALASAHEFLRAWTHKGEVSIYCGITSDVNSYLLVLSPEVLDLFVELGDSLELSLIFTVGDEPGEAPLSPEQIPEAVKSPSSSASLCFEMAARPGWPSAATDLGSAAVRTGSGGWQAVDEKPGVKSLSITAPVDQAHELETHLQWIDEFISQNLEAIRELIVAPAGAVVECSFATPRDLDTISLTSAACRPLAELNIPIEFNVRLV
jgi:hypothetical protein